MNRLPPLTSCKLPTNKVGEDFVIKAAIAGSPSRLRQFAEHEIDAVFHQCLKPPLVDKLP